MAVQPVPAAGSLLIPPGKALEWVQDHLAAKSPEDESSPISTVPKELFLRGIFLYLELVDLIQVDAVCREWRELASDPSLLNRNRVGLDIIGRINDLRGGWKGIDLEKHGVAPIPRALVEMPIPLAVVCHLLRRTEEATALPGSGVLLGIIPKGLTLGKVLAMAEESGVPMARSGEIAPYILKEYTSSVEQTRLVAMTGSVFNGSRNETYDQKQEMLRESGDSMPTMVEVVALALLASRKSGEEGRKVFPESALMLCRKENETSYCLSFFFDEHEGKYRFCFLSDPRDTGVAALRVVARVDGGTV